MHTDLYYGHVGFHVQSVTYQCFRGTSVPLKMHAVHSSEALVLHCTILEICITRIKEQTLRPLSHLTEKYII